MLAPPIAIVLLGAVAFALGAAILGAPGIALLLAGAAAMGIGLWLAVRVVSLRLVVEPDYLHLRGLGTDRRYHLAPGSLARVQTAGPGRVNLAVRLGSLGWTVGRATLPAGERVEVIRLGATPSVILVPTEQGRLALAVASEATFVEALQAASRTRAERPPPAPVSAAAPAGLAPVSAAAPAGLAPVAAIPAPVVAPPAPSPGAAPLTPGREPPRARPLTGIERMWLEDRLARERRAAQAGARDERAAASFTASVAALTPAGGRVAASLPAPEPAVAAALVPVTPRTPVAAAPALAAAPTAPSGALQRVIPRRRPLRPMARRVTRPELTPALVLVSAPLAGAFVSWLLAVILGSAPGTSGMDRLSAALLLCGPVAALAIFLAHSRWPRLAGLSSVAAMLSLLLVARAVIG